MLMMDERFFFKYFILKQNHMSFRRPGQWKCCVHSYTEFGENQVPCTFLLKRCASGSPSKSSCRQDNGDFLVLADLGFFI